MRGCKFLTRRHDKYIVLVILKSIALCANKFFMLYEDTRILPCRIADQIEWESVTKRAAYCKAMSTSTIC